MFAIPGIFFIISCLLIYMRVRLKSGFLKSMMQDKPEGKSNPYASFARRPLWKGRQRYYQMPDSDLYLELLKFLAPFWPEFVDRLKPKRAIQIEKQIAFASLALIFTGFAFFLSLALSFQ